MITQRSSERVRSRAPSTHTRPQKRTIVVPLLADTMPVTDARTWAHAADEERARARSTCNIPIDLPAFPAPPCSRNLGSNEPCQAAGGAAAHAVAARWGPRTTAQASDLPRRGGHGTGVRVPGRAHPARSPGRGRLRHAARHEERPLEKGGKARRSSPTLCLRCSRGTISAPHVTR